MSTKSKIEWTDRTWNPVTGCTKVSAGCKNCYAEREWNRLSANPRSNYYGREFTDVMCHPERLDQPRRVAKPIMYFVNSMSDLFHPDVPFAFIDQVMLTAMQTRHIYQILTKRPDRAKEYEDWSHTMGLLHGGFPRNVWLGASAEDQNSLNKRLPLLLQIQAAVRILSLEPLLDSIDFSEVETGIEAWDVFGDLSKYLHWVIVGGESGPKARPMAPAWAKDIRDQCVEAQVPFFFKQYGEWGPLEGSGSKHPTPIKFYRDGEWVDGVSSGDYPHVVRLGKKNAGRLLDGREWNEYPEAA